jgi:hypothetical protein
MKRRLRRRMRLKSKRESNKNHKPSRQARPEEDVSQIEPPHSLLLSSLRFWEVQRDLIEERVADIGR